MGKTYDEIALWHEKLVQSGVDDALIEQTRQVNAELCEKLMAVRPKVETASMKALYSYFANGQNCDDESLL